MTPNNIIKIAKVSIPLAVRNIARGIEKDKKLPRKLYMAYQSVNDIYVDNPTDSTLPLTSNYLYTLCAAYTFEAENLINIASGGQIPGQSSGGSVLQFPELKFTIGVPPSPMNAGDTVLVINADNIVPNTVHVHLDGSLMYEDAVDQASYHVAYSTNSITITFNIDGLGGGVINGQKFIIDYITLANNSSISIGAIIETPIEFTAVGGETTYTNALLQNKKIIQIARGGILTTQFTFNSSTSTISWNYPLGVGEEIYILYA